MVAEDRRVLIVEDEWILAMDLKLVLEGAGLHVSAASSAQEALRLAAAVAPDLLIMDIKLNSDMDGVEAYSLIKRELGLPVIYITGNADSMSIERAMRTGPVGIIIKPVMEDALVEAVSGFFSGKP